MRVIYSIFIKLYYFIILIYSPFNSKAKQWIKGRSSVQYPTVSKDEKVIWVHAASLGEFEQGRPVIEFIKRNHSEFKILLTFFSPSGYEVRKHYSQADYIYYLPLDTPKNVVRFLKHFHPEMAIFIKYEYWYNYLNQLKASKIPYFFISAIYRPQQVFFKNYGGWFLKHLQGAEHIFCQDKKSKLLLESVGVQQVTMAGDTRFDRVLDVTSKPKKIAEAEAFSRDCRIIILGSSWEPEEKILEEYLRTTSKDIKLIIAPHLIDSQHIENIVNLFNSFNPVLLSNAATHQDFSENRVLIIDAIGFLMHLYRYGELAIIGGGFGAGIHNVLEPAAFGLPILFGPKYHKFKEAKDLISMGGGFTFSNAREFKEKMDFLMGFEQNYKQASEISKNYVVENGGATQIITDKLTSRFRTILP